MKLVISRKILEELQQIAVDVFPEECCGILFGKDSTILSYALASNVAVDRKRHFEIDPAALIAAERMAREGKQAIVGYFHSHPTGDVRPSKTDAASAAPDGRFWLIIDRTKAAVWQSVQNGEIFDRFDPISLECKDA